MSIILEQKEWIQEQTQSYKNEELKCHKNEKMSAIENTINCDKYKKTKTQKTLISTRKRTPS